MFEIFPGPLAYSIVTTVFVGVCFIIFFNLKFGWVLSGLIVPGYLVPLFISKPAVATIIVIESLIAYLVAYYISERLAKRGLWSSFFGRDRFFLIILVSAVLRLVSETYLLPMASSFIVDVLKIEIDPFNNLSTVGLVIIPLTANTIWKPGLARGSFYLTTQLLCTYFVVAFILIPFTNFSVANLSFMYEQTALGISAGAKSYIILLTVAFVSSRFNLIYGWEYSGILIPSLLSLQWHEFHKIVFSFVECMFIFFLARLLLKTSFLKKINMEGARKILLFFAVSYFYKYVIALGLSYFNYTGKISEYFGFGYLLATLLALKMDGKKSIVRIGSNTFYICAYSALFGLTAGFFLNNFSSTYINKPEGIESPIEINENISLNENFFKTQISVYDKNFILENTKSTGAALKKLGKSLKFFSDQEKWVSYLNQNNLTKHFSFLLVEQKYIFVVPKYKIPGFGFVVLNIDYKENASIYSDLIFDYLSPVEVAFSYFVREQAKIFIVFEKNEDFILNESREGRSLSEYAKVQRRIFRIFKDDTPNSYLYFNSQTSNENIIHTHVQLASFLEMDELQRDLGKISSKWNVLNESFTSQLVDGFSEITLSSKTILQQKINNIQNQINKKGLNLTIDKLTYNRPLQTLQDYILKYPWPVEGEENYITPTRGELYYFEKQVLDLLSSWHKTDLNSIFPQGTISLLEKQLGYFNYSISQFGDKKNKTYFIYEVNPEKFWGFFMINFDAQNRYFVQVPRPKYEYKTPEVALEFFEYYEPTLILFNGSHSRTYFDQLSDPVVSKNVVNWFNLVNQFYLRNSHKEILPVQFRQLLEGRMADYKWDIGFSFFSYYFGDELNGLEQGLVNFVKEKSYSHVLLEDSEDYLGFRSSPQSNYLRQTKIDNLAMLWISPSYLTEEKKKAFIQKIIDDPLLNIETVNIENYLSDCELSKGFVTKQLKTLFDETRESLDIRLLYAIKRNNYQIKIDTAKGVVYGVHEEKNKCLGIKEIFKFGNVSKKIDKYNFKKDIKGNILKYDWIMFNE